MSRHALRLAAALLLVAVVMTDPAHAAVEDYADYQPQQHCASAVQPGTGYLARWLVRRHPGTGLSSLLRGCDSGGSSEHKDGRAIDWSLDATDPADQARAQRFLDQVFATDKQGNRHALARRMGIMYVIWDDRSWSSYRGFKEQEYLSSSCHNRRSCSPTLRHRDHVHISLSRAGAAAQTSFYRSRGVPSVPVLKPGTDKLDPVDTAMVELTVPADSSTVTTDFRLEKGTTYRIVADGLYRYGAGSRIADPACAWTSEGWRPARSLLVNGTSPWSATCGGRHTHVAHVTPKRTQPLTLRVADSTPADNRGRLTVAILRQDLPARRVATAYPRATPAPAPARRPGKPGKALKVERLSVPAAAERGVKTRAALRRSERYKVVVRGVARSGQTAFDGRCVEYAGRFRPQHSLDLTAPAADHLAVYVQGVPLQLRAAGSNRLCVGGEHRYVGTLRPVAPGRARVQVWDPFDHADNSGALTVTLRRR